MSISPLQRVGLSPQNLGSELSKLAFDSLPALRIARDGAVGRHTTSEQSQLATNEEATKREQSVSREITQSRGFQKGCEIWNWLYYNGIMLAKYFLLMLCKPSFQHQSWVGESICHVPLLPFPNCTCVGFSAVRKAWNMAVLFARTL